MKSSKILNHSSDKAIVCFIRFCMVCAAITFIACNDEETSINTPSGFQKIESTYSKIAFSNNLIEDKNLNYFTYPYLYMGGGVAVGDINNDGLDDIFFTGNMVPNRLYLNKGDFIFEDITETANIAGDDRWYAGVTMVDINADGYLDIYVSVSGKDKTTTNQLYINNQDLTYTESAATYGIADEGKSVQSTFFDYDKDGDLDLYVANYPITNFSTPNEEYRKRMDNITLADSDHFYKNNGDGTFTDITEYAGLLSYGLSLSATVGDLNGDGWEDIYVSNDFSTPDFLYINNADGTFTDQLKQSTKQTSFYGMGADIADFNNDGRLDIMQVDMAAEDNRRAKANMASMNPGLFWSTVEFGMHYQYMYNSLQLNRGEKDGTPILSNVAWMADVATTDWSWGPLFADFDNDGWKDLFISNGTRRDINNRDFFSSLKKDLVNIEQEDLVLEVENIPSEPIGNYIFRNNQDLTYSKANKKWSVDMVGFSNGGAYADLNNDGRLDIIVNNIDEPAYIYKNNIGTSDNTHYLKVQLSQKEENTYAIGSKVRIVADKISQWQHLTLSRGFQSCVAPSLHFGVNQATVIDSLIVTWPDGNNDIFTNIKVDQSLAIKKEDAIKSSPKTKNPNSSKHKFFTQSARSSKLPVHVENEFDDYKFQILLPHKMSQWGPALATADINNDGLDDFYLGGASRSPGEIYLQKANGTFTKYSTFTADETHEDIDAQFVDIDNDGDLDLIVVSGGYELPYKEKYYADRLYINNDGTFTRSKDFPEIASSGGCVRPYDYDNDGDMDLFIGGRMKPALYPAPGQSYLLRNDLKDGKLSFTDVTSSIMPDVAEIGMVTDAVWADYDGDNQVDLVVVGEWMPISVLLSDGATYTNQTNKLQLEDTRGWWFTIEQGDVDDDGDMDFVLGNLGKNYKYQATASETFDLYVKDFDQNASSDIVLSYYHDGIQYPVRGRQCSSDQVPGIQTKFKDYESFATATLAEIYGESQIASADHYEIKSFASILLLNQGHGNYQTVALPIESQLSAIADICLLDVNEDGNTDIITAGNLYMSEVETPRNDAGIGCTLLGDGKGNFRYAGYQESGLLLNDDVRKLALIKGKNKKFILSASNNGPMSAHQMNGTE